MVGVCPTGPPRSYIYNYRYKIWAGRPKPRGHDGPAEASDQGVNPKVGGRVAWGPILARGLRPLVAGGGSGMCAACVPAVRFDGNPDRPPRGWVSEQPTGLCSLPPPFSLIYFIFPGHRFPNRWPPSAGRRLPPRIRLPAGNPADSYGGVFFISNPCLSEKFLIQ